MRFVQLCLFCVPPSSIQFDYFQIRSRKLNCYGLIRDCIPRPSEDEWGESDSDDDLFTDLKDKVGDMELQ